MIWQESEATAPELAQVAKARFDQAGVALLGTLQRDGAPRIDPIEPFFANGHLLLGMLPKTRKANNLLRDPRCVLHSVVSRSDGSEGEIKLYGRALSLSQGELWDAYGRAFGAKHTGPPPEGFPRYVFSLDIDRAVSIRWDTANFEMFVSRWSPAAGSSETRQTYP